MAEGAVADPPFAIASLVCALVLAAVHLFAGRLTLLNAFPRSQWLSMAGGISVAYVFLRLLPELGEAQRTVEEASGSGLMLLPFLPHHVYLVALLGLAAFYGLEHLARRSREETGEREAASIGVFWLHVISFGLYNALIGYFLVHRERSDLLSLALFTLAMAFHFVVNDQGLREHHKQAYSRLGRWLLAFAIVLGWGIGLAFTINETRLSIMLAFLAGGIILNVLKEELTPGRTNRFGAFAVGLAVNSAILLAI